MNSIEYLMFCFAQGWMPNPILKENRYTITDGSHNIVVREDVSGLLVILTVAPASEQERSHWFCLYPSAVDELTLASWHNTHSIHVKYADRGAIEALLRVAIRIGRIVKGAQTIRFKDSVYLTNLPSTVANEGRVLNSCLFYGQTTKNTLFEEANRGYPGHFTFETNGGEIVARPENTSAFSTVWRAGRSERQKARATRHLPRNRFLGTKEE